MVFVFQFSEIFDGDKRHEKIFTTEDQYEETEVNI